MVEMATTLLVAGLTLTLWMTGQMPFAAASSNPSLVQMLPICFYAASLRLVPINARHMMTMLFKSSKQWQPEGQTNSLQCSQLHHQGEFWHVSVSVQWQSCSVVRYRPFL